MTHEPPILTSVGDGVARISWHPGTPVDVVRHEVAQALLAHTRVEVWIDPDDESAHRVATWSGMQREGVMRGVQVSGDLVDRVVYARLSTDAALDSGDGFRALLNSFLPRKRAISQMLIRDTEGRVLLCELTYKSDRDLPGGVVEVGESPHLAVGREVTEELGLTIEPGRLLLTDWLPPWAGWDDALCLVFDGGVHDPSLAETIVRQTREIAGASFCDLDEIRAHCADYTARRIESALRNLDSPGPTYVESGTPLA